MSQFFRIHPENPQLHLIRETVAIIRNGGVIVYPTDSAYALGCHIGMKDPLQKIRQIRRLDEKHNFTLMCRDLSELSTYAKVDNSVFRLLKAYTPGSYTFILKATKEVPRRLQHPRRKTIGLRVPDNVIALAILDALESPMMSTTLILPGHELPLIEPEAIRDVLGKQIDLVIDGGYCGVEQTTVVDLVEGSPKILRYGKGEVGPFQNIEE
jgi:tRNA threonylcarbamoyl adenosine modification protein (Sua5/YciO/YrdC/YwlC family)